MSRRCEVTGAVPVLGHRIIRSGKSKKSGGIGMHVTANTPRKFRPNLLPFTVTSRPGPLLSADQQAEAWTRSLGEY